MEEDTSNNQAFGWPQYTVRGILTMFSQAVFAGGVLFAYMTGGVDDAVSIAGILGPVAGVAAGMYFTRTT